jgi:formylglycine-generating enzyme required for sulfatase activity
LPDRHRAHSRAGGQDDLVWDQWIDRKGYEIASTTLVGQFPGGNSVAGVSDTCGNVWEWMCSWYYAKKVYRTLRGGSWSYDRWDARCASRGRFVPDYFDYDVGLRVVSPGSISAF